MSRQSFWNFTWPKTPRPREVWMLINACEPHRMLKMRKNARRWTVQSGKRVVVTQNMCHFVFFKIQLSSKMCVQLFLFFFRGGGGRTSAIAKCTSCHIVLQTRSSLAFSERSTFVTQPSRGTTMVTVLTISSILRKEGCPWRLWWWETHLPEIPPCSAAHTKTECTHTSLSQLQQNKRRNWRFWHWVSFSQYLPSFFRVIVEKFRVFRMFVCSKSTRANPGWSAAQNDKQTFP